MSDEQRVHLSRAEPAAYQTLSAYSKTVGEICKVNGVDDRLKELVQIHASQRNGCSYCVRVHVDRAQKIGITADVISQLPVWRDSGVFTDRERAGLELTESMTFIAEGGITDEVYDSVGAILSEKEYVALCWLIVSINAFNRIAIAGRYGVPPREDLDAETRDGAAGTAW